MKYIALGLLLALHLGASAQSSDALYRAWGEKAGIEAVMADFVPRLKADARIGKYFKDTNAKHLTEQLTLQLCQLAGGPCRYEGPDMKSVHEGMDLRRADFNALVEQLQLSMEAKGIPFAAQNRMLSLLAPMHRDIVNPRPQ